MARTLKPFRIERQPVVPAAEPRRAPDAPGAVPGVPLPHLDFTQADLIALRSALSAGAGLSRAADELAAIVNDTARAANVIIGASEEIDNLVLRLRASGGRDTGGDVADELAENAMAIFQACGFQDLTGQRIANIVDVLHEFERKLTALRDLWDGVVEKRASAAPLHERIAAIEPVGLENGPRLPADAGHLTQSEIDAIFE